MNQPSENGAVKTRKPRTGKPLKPLEGEAVSKVKSTIHLTLQASQRLDVHCSMDRMDRSELVEHLINTHLRRYVVSDRGGSAVRLAEDVRESA